MKNAVLILMAVFAFSAQVQAKEPSSKSRVLASEGTGLQFSCSTSESGGWVSKEIPGNGDAFLDIPFGRGTAKVHVMGGAEVKNPESYIVIIETGKASVSGALGAKDSYGLFRPVILSVGKSFISCQMDKYK